MVEKRYRNRKAGNPSMYPRHHGSGNYSAPSQALLLSTTFSCPSPLKTTSSHCHCCGGSTQAEAPLRSSPEEQQLAELGRACAHLALRSLLYCSSFVSAEHPEISSKGLKYTFLPKGGKKKEKKKEDMSEETQLKDSPGESIFSFYKART